MKYNNGNTIKNNTEIWQAHEDGHSKNDHHKCGYCYFKRLISYIMAFILTAVAACTALAINPSTTVHVHAEEKKGYHRETLSKTYNIVRLDDDPHFSSATKFYRENSKSRFEWPYCVWCGECKDAYGNNNHWFSQAACYYGFYDDTVYGTWTITGVHMYGGEANRISSSCANPLHSGGDGCNETHGKSAPSQDLNCETNDVKTFDNVWAFDYFNNYVKINGSAVPRLSLQNLANDKGCSFSFSAENGLGGTITVSYPDAWVPNEYTITFNPNNGGNAFTGTAVYDTGDCNVASSYNPTLDGYDFGGWYTGTNGTGEQVYDKDGKAVNSTYWLGSGSSAVWKGVDDINLYAKWMANNCTITLKYYKNGTLDTTKTHEAAKGTTFKISDYSSDVAYGSNYEYSTADSASWTVTADKTVNIYYTGKKYTQTLNFYKDSTKDSSKTYSAGYGTTFNAEAHKGDVTFGDAYEYNKIDNASWTVTGESSTNVYYKKKSYTITLNFYKNGTYKKSKTYTAYHGDTFNAASHADDMTGDTDFAHCHYDHMGVSETSWIVTGGASADVYYVWDTYTIAYDGNGSTGGSTAASTATSHGSSATVASNGFTRTGHHFTGWNTATDGSGTAYSEGSSMTMTGNVTLYAQWSIDRHTVTLNKGNGISGVSGAGTYDYGSSVSIDATLAAGYSWNRWTGSNETTVKNYRFTIYGDDLSFTANATPNVYTVSLNANGGSCVDGSGNAVSSVSVTYDSGDWNNVSGLRVSRDGYEFTGWAANAAGSWEPIWDVNGLAKGGSYWKGNGDSAVWQYTGNVTASADWKDVTPPIMSVSPENSSGYAASVYITITASDNDRLAADNVYEYCLGTDSSAPPSDASWSSYQSGVPITIGNMLSGACYLWVKHVKDAAGNTSVSSPNADYHRFGPYYFDNTAPDLSGVLSSYGWFSEGTTITFNISDTHSGIGRVVLADFNGIQLDNGDITSGRQYYFGSEGPAFYCLTVTDNVGNTAKKLFLVKIDSKGEVIPDNAVWKGLGNLALFAHWSANSYTVHFEKNDNDSGSTRATGSMSNVTFTYDKNETLPANGFSRTGYAFDGWNRSADGTADNGVNYPDGGTVRNLTLIPGGTATLYAQWKPLEYMLAFDYSRPGNATGNITGADEASRKVTFDSSIGRLPEPRLTGWVFEGWYVDGTIVNGSYMGGTKLKSDDIWNYTSDKTAFAKWTPAKYEVRLHSSVPDEALGTLVKPSDSGLTASGWTWKENEYYSAVFTYDTESLLPAAPDTYSIVYTAGGQDTTEYAISGWYKNSLLSDYTGGGEIKKWNLSAAGGAVIDLYPSWRDTSAPVIDVTPTHTVNPDADNDAVRSIDITITVTECGSGLRTDNSYEYGFSASASALPSEWESYGSASSPSGFTTSLPDLGASMDGYYYLWVRQVMDNSGSLSVSPSALATVNSCHVYGIYVFDNTAPSGKTEYTENNLTLGLYNDSITDSPYAVMTIHDPHDDIAGIAGYVLRISDAADPSNSVDHAFTPDDSSGTYICRFNLYDSLPDAEDIEQVRMCIVSKDKLGNEATIPITRYDFGTLQTGEAIRAEDIGYRELSDIPDASSPTLPTSYKYIRDYFRVEAYIENISYKASGTTFMGGHKGQLRIYVFGYVDNVSADFGSIKKFILPAYDTNPDLSRTDIVPPEREKLYLHEFFVPLYCANSTYTDTTAFGYKRNSVQKRCVIYDVSDTLAYKIKTILKYNAK